MLRRRYEILLPLQYNDGLPVSDQKLEATREELLEHFEGVSFSLQPMFGLWRHEGVRYEDASTRVIVDVDDTPENEQFFADFKLVLRERFQQIEIYIFSYAIKVV